MCSHVPRVFTLVSPDFWVGDAEVREKQLEVALSQSEHGWDPDTKYLGLDEKLPVPP